MASQGRSLSISGLREKHLAELENLTLTTQPLRTLKFFVFAVTQFIRQTILQTRCWFLLSCTLLGIIGILVMIIGGTHEMQTQKLIHYLEFGVWWLALGVASSIGLGSGLHTFVLYLGPHIAFFTIKAVKCGRVDLKVAPYDTIRLNTGPSWLNRNCSDYGPPMFPSSRVPVGSILPQIQLEAILWGIGTALGELPPYFISRAASISGSKLDFMKVLDSSSTEDSGGTANHLKQIENWLRLHSQYLHFFTILALASVPNPLFDLAGIMCGQLGIPFWKFFFATLIGKAVIKTHIQTVFIISVCNYQLLDFMENEMIRVLSFMPGLGTILPKLVTKLHTIRDKYISPSPPVSSNIKVKSWDLSFASIWNTVVWLMLLNFLFKIVKATAQNYLKHQQEKELMTLSNDASASNPSTSQSS